MSNSRTTLVVEDEISTTLHKYPPSQLLGVVSGLRPLVVSNQAQAREVLAADENLTYAIVQSMLLMGLVDGKVIQDAMAISDGPAPGAGAGAKTGSPAPQSRSSTPQLKQPQTSAEKLAALDPQQASMIRQVLALTEEQIGMLPTDQQGTIRSLREQYR